MFLLLPLLTFGLTVLLLRLLLGNGRLLAADIPNHRSLHEGAIPRGGGIAFVISVVIAFGLFYLFSDIIAWWPAALLILLLGSAFLGWLDDHHNLSIIIRLIMQFLLASFAWIFVVHNGSWQTSIAWFPMALIGFVWSMNLVNFMDGMDGLAATQGILGGGALCVWLYLAGANQEVLFMLVWIAGLCAFLIFNWHPARVFMGDTGSLAL
ncbi:MAG: Fuc2NAc and GlcNAc transferase, partial [Gammaproteobacteria bacterium]